MAVDLVRKGGRQDFACAGCGKFIARKESHYKEPAKEGKRYHKGCLPEGVKKSKQATRLEQPVPA